VKIVECPRDAMQGIHEFIPTDLKIEYINQLLEVGFHTIDFGSFVSPKAIPQMADTAKVFEGLDLSSTKSKLLAIVANERGAEDASQYDEISFLGFPFSISETFQQRNTNSSIKESLERVKRIQDICVNKNKQLVVYVSMAFGNPYGDPWGVEIVEEWTTLLHNEIGVNTISLSDTIGVSNPENINYLFSNLIPRFADLEIGAHLHTTPFTWEEKVEAAYNSGCRRFDGALKGYGGCPMAKDELTGNMPTENMINYFEQKDVNLALNIEKLDLAMNKLNKVFL